ncbi:tRNA (N6-threonylcarbamoyladenosine(37)-N6)-methyltransferase TrmO [Photobacterium minamisatsumaniensis]|uniref:tRNA (N6-threonylcarbamoyladenosine(37)-N6)-methyltransferase TrmO n=1 Tax=Photobacterium minamisatsumaniensis TaxID=2910233 RepID=UPI003D0E1EDC
MTAELKFIGFINTPFKKIKDCPNNIQLDGNLCDITLYDEYKDGLLGLVTGQHILILYWLGCSDNKADIKNACVQKTCKSVMKGTFALRSPLRPNPIGAAVLPIEKLEGGKITVRGLDCLDKTKLIDIKPAIYHEVENGK